MNLALIQMLPRVDKADNLAHARELVQAAAAAGADLVMLPEMFCCEYKNSAFIENRESIGGLTWQMLSRTAAAHAIWLIGGSIPEAAGDHTYNTSFVFDRSGRQAAFHRKMHLFDIDVSGGQRFYESDTFSAGDKVTVFDSEFGKLGLCICFDIRFPELARLMALDGAKVILCPASFNMTTGPAHWELMFRARAVENQVFSAGCASARDVNGSYVSYGNSIIASPWGDVLARAGAEETILYADLDLEVVEKIRKEIPLMNARRTDVYTLKNNQ
ncbi:MAG TPA: carbon-nitrogen hydrolase family protein [Anaerolineaceae bacterium]|nr:carbon-nitrogen hydrolase family protein [Anaerolineaceae bacterium]